MEKKKYVLKTDVVKNEKSADGTENSEHIIDMIERVKMCQANIQDNTDLCVKMFNLKKENLDEDEVDALQLLCQDLIAIEQQANAICGIIEEIEKNIFFKKFVEEGKVEEILKNVLILELHSQEIVDKVLKI